MPGAAARRGVRSSLASNRWRSCPFTRSSIVYRRWRCGPCDIARAAARQPSGAPVRIAREAETGKLPARCRREEISVGRANVRARRDAGAATQYVLIAHEFSVVLADRAGGRTEARVRRVVALRPFPHIAEHLRERAGRS